MRPPPPPRLRAPAPSARAPPPRTCVYYSAAPFARHVSACCSAWTSTARRPAVSSASAASCARRSAAGRVWRQRSHALSGRRRSSSSAAASSAWLCTCPCTRSRRRTRRAGDGSGAGRRLTGAARGGRALGAARVRADGFSRTSRVSPRVCAAERCVEAVGGRWRSFAGTLLRRAVLLCLCNWPPRRALWCSACRTVFCCRCSSGDSSAPASAAIHVRVTNDAPR